MGAGIAKLNGALGRAKYRCKGPRLVGRGKGNLLRLALAPAGLGVNPFQQMAGLKGVACITACGQFKGTANNLLTKLAIVVDT